ncbi:MAG: cytochrome C peroxidase [Acidobacteria bacterium]|nr:cytochrome C peroxidase [Acidobacteriota bacterium]
MSSRRLLLLLMASTGLCAQQLRTLKGVPVPEPPALGDYVADRTALVALGKALFWDMQAGSDGRTACASCHFHAGADHRIEHQIADPLHEFPTNVTLDPVMFPFRVLADPLNRGSVVTRDTGMRVGSMGLFLRKFVDIVPGQATEIGEELADRVEFSSAGRHLRQVTSRNAPTVINSVFTVLNFWDGRANRVFNGFDPAGDARPGILTVSGGQLTRAPVSLDRASLASQAAGPILDTGEMSYKGRTWPKIGKKILSLPPLALQQVAAGDSVLGSMARVGGRGLRDGVSYESLIRSAFAPALWESSQLVDGEGAVLAGRNAPARSTSEFTQQEYNFSFFWSVALMAYQSTSVSNDSPFDRFMEGDSGALTAEEQDGMRFFQNNGRCTTCHSGAEFTRASFSAGNGRNNRAFQNTGVRPASEDAGRGNGSFKTSGLRNVALTGPYMHNGGQATLEQVVEFYARGGDFGNNGIRSFNSNSANRAALVAFMKALTDERVLYDRAPFDHPELCVPNRHLMNGSDTAAFPASAGNAWVSVPATGAGGHSLPLQTFAELLGGRSTGRSHTMTDPCTVPLP